MEVAKGILRATLKLIMFVGTAFLLMQPFVGIIMTFASKGTPAQHFISFGSNLLQLLFSLLLFYFGTPAVIAFSDKYFHNRILQLLFGIVSMMALYGITIISGSIAQWLVTTFVSILKYILIALVILVVIVFSIIKWVTKWLDDDA